MDTSAYHPPHQLGPSSLDLLQRASRSDDSSWRDLVLLYGPVIRYWIRRRGIVSGAETDVFHEVFVAVQRQLQRTEGAEGAAKFRVWLKAVAVCKIAEFHRRQQSCGASAADSGVAWQLLQEFPAEFFAATDTVLNTHGDKPPTRQALQILRDEYSDQHWRAFWRTAIDGCSATAAADELGLTPVAVRKARSNVLATLREYLNGSGESVADSAAWAE